MCKATLIFQSGKAILPPLLIIVKSAENSCFSRPGRIPRASRRLLRARYAAPQTCSNTDIVRRKNGAGKRAFQVRKSENWFSERLPRMGAKKKLVARISKSEPLILKSKPLIFHPVKTRPAGAGDQWPFGHKTICYMFRKCGQKSRAAWRGRMWNVKRGIRAAVCSGSARDTRWTGVRPRARLRISRLCPTHVRSRGRRRL